MDKAGSVLDHVLQGQTLVRATQVARLIKDWSRCVGDAVAAHSIPSEIRDGMLVITVDTPVWMQQLSFFKSEMLKKLEPYGVTNLRLKVGRISKAAAEEGRRAPAPLPPLTPEQAHYLEICTAAIKDEELKQHVQRLLHSALTKKPSGRSESPKQPKS